MSSHTPDRPAPGSSAPGRPTPDVYAVDGRILDPFHVLGEAARLPAGSRQYAAWQQRVLRQDHAKRQSRDDILTAAARLDPSDTSPDAEHLREVAAQQRAHAEMDARRVEWAAAALQSDPALADRMNPAIVQAARSLLDQLHDTAEPHARLRAEHDRGLAIAARLEGPGIDDIGDRDQAHDLPDTAADSAEADYAAPAVDLADDDGDDFGA